GEVRVWVGGGWGGGGGAEEEERLRGGAGGELSNPLAIDATERAIVDLPIPRLAEATLLDLVVSAGAPGEAFRRVASTRQRAELSGPGEARAGPRPPPDAASPDGDAAGSGRPGLVASPHDSLL